jgi:acetyl esterase/lipase
LRDPKISPLYGRFDWLPPLLIHVGAREVLLGDAARLAERARAAGVDAQLRVYDGMFHLFHMHYGFQEAKDAHRDIADFIRTL